MTIHPASKVEPMQYRIQNLLRKYELAPEVSTICLPWPAPDNDLRKRGAEDNPDNPLQTKDKLDHPTAQELAFDLLIWSALFNRPDLAKMFWSYTKVFFFTVEINQRKWKKTQRGTFSFFVIFDILV